jgi:hypothetical protein
MRTIAFPVAWLLALAGGQARADEPVEGASPSAFDHAVPASVRALEIGLGGGYFQGTGDVGDGMNRVQDVSGPGGGLELQIGYRPIAPLALGAFGTFSQHGTGDQVQVSAVARSATAGAFADWHFRPARSIDPWVGLSTGWRGMWLVPDEGKSTSVQGLEIARLQVGLDYRITPQIAIAPVIGASVSIYLTQDGPATTGYANIGSPQPNFFFFGGLMARFDLLGTIEPASTVIASSR